MVSGSSSPSPSRSRKHDLYAVLGVAPTSSPEEVRRGFKQRALATHPDKASPRPFTEQEKEEIENQFHEVYQAFETLNDPVKRKEYDRGLRNSSEMKASFEKRWAEHDERALQRARERQEWAERAESRHQERMREMRETKRRQREEYLEAKKREREEAEMINRMLDALCDLGSSKYASERVESPRNATKRTARSVSAPVSKQNTRDKLDPEECKMRSASGPVENVDDEFYSEVNTP